MGDAETDRSGRSAVFAAALGAILPGLGHGYLGRWLRAALMFLPFVALLTVAYVALRMRSLDLLAILVRPPVLRGILIANIAVVVWRVVAVVDPYRISRGKHSVGALVTVAVLSVVVAAPHVLIARYTLDAAHLLDEVFVTDSEVGDRVIEESPSGPVAAPFAPGDSAIVEVADPRTQPREARPGSVRNLRFREAVGDPEAVASSPQSRQYGDRSLRTLVGSDAEGVERITILLTGGDGGPGRSGQRTDSIMVATFDTTTGKAAAFGIPRNMTHVPLPDEWSTAFVELEKRLIPWDERKTWTDDDGDGEPDQFIPCNCFPDQINAIYPFTRKWYDTYPNEVDPGLAALRDTLEIMLGIEIDYYAMIDMNGFVQLVDALGGVRAYLTSSVQTDVSPVREGEDWIEIDLSPGWNRLNGHEALAYVRERRSTSDYTRMERQRCLLKAVAAQSDATTVVRRFSAISRAIAASVKTDINIDYLPTLLGYAASLDFNDIATIGFVPPYYTPKVDFRGKPTPDLNRIQAMVRWVLNAEPDTEFVSGRDSECRI
ncbi:MAG: hypothetical protein BMS9Abin20_0001 [Acidimicrobiia bacterium]|nr:MAG: hypothetical protein BMS9Abin20_0001 [Acidimicrobiia bacterium]